MSPIRLVFALACVTALSCGPGDVMAAKRDGRHAGHLPRVNAATYTYPARSRVRVLRMVGAHGSRYAQERHHGLLRRS